MVERYRNTHEVETFHQSADGGAASPRTWAWLRPLPETLVTRVTAEDHLARLAARGGDVRFLHIGAHDGVSDERLERYIREHGWRGVFVEPVPGLLRQLQENYRDLEGLRFENSAIAESNRMRPFFEVLPTPEMPHWVSQLSSLRKDVILAHADAVPGIEKRIVERPVSCISVETLLRKHEIDRIDVVLIDTEGYDYEIIRQLDLGELQPRIVIYEEKHLSLRDRNAARQRLTAAGYTVEKSGTNDCVAVPAATCSGTAARRRPRAWSGARPWR